MVPPQVLKDHAEMALVLKLSLEPDDVFLVLGIGQRELLQNVNLLEAGFLPARASASNEEAAGVYRGRTDMVSLLRITLMATSFLPLQSIARTTPENMPFPRLACTWYRPSSSSPRMTR